MCQQHILEVDHSEPIESVAIAPDDQLVASGGWDGTIRLWNRETGSTVREIKTVRGRSSALLFHPMDVN